MRTLPGPWLAHHEEGLRIGPRQPIGVRLRLKSHPESLRTLYFPFTADIAFKPSWKRVSIAHFPPSALATLIW
jgi:hypothetical protein